MILYEDGRVMSLCSGIGCAITTLCLRYQTPRNYRVWSATCMCRTSRFTPPHFQFLVYKEAIEHFPPLSIANP